MSILRNNRAKDRQAAGKLGLMIESERTSADVGGNIIEIRAGSQCANRRDMRQSRFNVATQGFIDPRRSES